MKENCKFKKIVTIVIDSFGIGQATDAKEFDDVGADTFGHILEYRPDLKIDNLYQLGFTEIFILVVKLYNQKAMLVRCMRQVVPKIQ